LLLPEIKKGTPLAVTLGDGREFTVEYMKNTDYENFSIRSSDIAADVELLKGATMDVKFSTKMTECSFSAKIMGLASKFASTDIVDCVVTSLLKETPRRSDARIDISLRVKVYSYVDDPERKFIGDFLCESVSDNVSRGGVRLFSDFKLEDLPDSMYTLAFSFPQGELFVLPARIVRNQRNTSNRSYSYDYGLIFDFDYLPEYREKLILNVLQAKITSRK